MASKEGNGLTRRRKGASDLRLDLSSPPSSSASSPPDSPETLRGRGKGKGKARKALESEDSGSKPAPSSSVWLRVPLLSSRASPGTNLNPNVNIYKDGHARLSAPSTPWHELDLSDSFLSALHAEPIKRTFWQRRRLYFLFGALLGIFGGWLFTEGDPLSALNMSLDLDNWSTFDLQHLMSELPSLNVTEILSPGREWLTTNNKGAAFTVGREVADRGQTKKHAVILIPGIVSTGLESWSTTPAAAPYFRKRIWASTTMLRAIVSSKETWVAAMALDEETGLDPDGGREFKVRAAQGLDAATSFMPGYWIWAKVIENLAAVDYDHNDLQLFSYDWRLAYVNLEVRDQYFSRLKYAVELNLAVNGKKTALVSHSMGALVVLWFLKWVEAEQHGNGGSEWCERHISDWVNIGGTLLGVPKAMSALLSGEMRDTVEINAAAVYLLEKYFSRSERAKLFRSWPGAASMMLKGGNDVWGDDGSAPDDKHNATLSGGKIYYFRPEAYSNTSDLTEQHLSPNVTMSEAVDYILQHVPNAYQRMIASNYSFGFERDPETLAANDHDHRKWTNPLEVRLPNAPSMSITCLYGHGKETERAYFYQQGGYERDEVAAPGTPHAVCDAEAGSCTNQTERVPLDMPLSRRSWIDSSVTLDTQEPAVRSGVVFGEGDGTVSLLSLGSMCVDGWKRDLYNPGKMKVVTHEIKHEPMSFDVRGGPRSADHVDILGNSELNEAVLDSHGHRVGEVLFSEIEKYAARIKWDG